MSYPMIHSGQCCIRQAIISDQDHQYKHALSLYTKGIGLILNGSNHLENQIMRNRVRGELGPIMSRAEEIKKIVAKGVTTQEEEKLVVQSKQITGNISWDDIAGLKEAKELLQQTTLLPILFPQLYKDGIRKPCKGILLYGPPGTGKTFLAKAVATESKSAFLTFSSADIMSKWQGDSEKAVKSIFEEARTKKPSVIFFDEIEGLCSNRDSSGNESSKRIIGEFLTQMDGIGNDQTGILVLGATNLPWDIDAAMRRRFEKRVYISLPTQEDRYELFSISIKKRLPDLIITKDQLIEFASITNGLSGADISIVIDDAINQPVGIAQKATHFKEIEKNVYQPCEPVEIGAIKMNLFQLKQNQFKPNDVTYEHFKQALIKIKASVGQELLERYREWTNQYGQDG